MNNLRNIIVVNRKKLKLTQRELAERINVSDKQISKWETGISYPDVTIINSLAKALEISVSELLESDDLIAFEHQDKIDYDLLQKIKSTGFLSISFIVTAYMLFGIGFLLSQEIEVVGMILVSISPFVIFFSIIYLATTNMKEQNKIKSHNYAHVYVKSFYYKNLIYLSIFIATLVILIIINGTRLISAIQHLNLVDIMFNLFYLIVIFLFEIIYLLKRQLDIKATYPIVNKITKIGLYVVFIVFVVATIMLNIYVTNTAGFRLLYTLTYIMVQFISILLPITLILNLVIQYFIIKKE